ncbi:MAG: NHL repeat-containing protein [Candidatus Riflebacteria bacterium]|nr:NHL repeat-containing protein [Candidatus Riflebacteria bacterium]
MFNKKTAMLLLISVVLATGCVPDKFQYDKEFGKSGSNRGEFLSATDLDITREGNLVLADAGNTRVQVLSTDGNSILVAGESGREGYKLQSIAGIGVNHLTNDIWVCDQRGNKIVRFGADGTANLKATSKMKYPMDVAIDRTGDAYVIMSNLPEIYKFDSSGNYLATIGGSGKAALVFPTSILIHENHIYVSDFGGKRIVKMNIEGHFVAEFKDKGEYEEMKGPSGMHIDKDGNLYILDLGEVPVVILSSSGKFISKIGDFGNQPGSFLYPTGVIAKSSDEIYVLDNSRNTILNFKKKPE